MRRLLPTTIIEQAIVLVFALPLVAVGADPVDLGSRIELFVDRHLVEELRGVELRLHPPRPADVVIKRDYPWESNSIGAFSTVFWDEGKLRLYYRTRAGQQATCYAESVDGVHWTKPMLGLFEYDGSKENNIVWMGHAGGSNLAPFKDTRPGVPSDERYKALAYADDTPSGLAVFYSQDGIHWRVANDSRPVIANGNFDSLNVPFWDAARQKYVCYYRYADQGIRSIAIAESDDFLNWTDTPLKPIVVPGPKEHFYTNSTTVYFRSPQYYFAFPMRFVPERNKLPGHLQTGVSDVVFLSSRDGVHFDREFREALIRPGLDQRNWGARCSIVACGLFPFSETEMGILYTQHWLFDSAHVKLGLFRLDGIASAHAGSDEGELVTKPLRFAGSRLIVNYSTSAVGKLKVEIQDANGAPLPGFQLDDAGEMFGDEIAAVCCWKGSADVSALAGQVVRLRFVMQDADLYSYRFGEASTADP